MYHDQDIDVMFLCDKWKSSRGDLSTIIRELAVNLAKSPSIKVHYYVSQSDEADEEDANRNGVNLITVQAIPGLDPMECVKIPPPEISRVDVVIGHGAKFGPPAYFIKRSTKCKWIQFVYHACPEDLFMFKLYESPTRDEMKDKYLKDIELCKEADKVVAVGSLVQDEYQKVVSLSGIKVETITPGVLEEFSIPLTHQLDTAKVFKVFVFNRATCEDFVLKGYDIIANAIASLGEKFVLTFVGSPPGQLTAVMHWFQEQSKIKMPQLILRGFCTQEEQIKTLKQADVVVLPSRTEGFGLVALEAISASIPVLVSNHSGIAKALERVDGGDSVIVECEDSNEWAKKIQHLSKQTVEERLISAMQLRETYERVYSWHAECEKIVKMIHDLVEGSQSKKVVKQGTPTDDELEELAEKIETKWKKLGRRLGINDEMLQEIQQAHDELSERGYYMLKNWKQKQGSDATYRALCKALKHDLVKRQDLAEQFCYIKHEHKWQKENAQEKISVRQFQMPPRIFGSMFGSDMLFADGGSEQETGSMASEDTKGYQETLSSSESGFDEAMDINYTGFAGALDISCDEKSEIHLTENKSLHLTAKGGNIANIEKLLSQGCEIDARDSDEMTPLMIAAIHGRAAVVKFLLKKGASAFLKSEDGSTLLHFASWGGNVAIIEEVVKQGVYIDSTDNYDNTPLMYAASHGKIQVVDILLKLGADPFQEGRYGRNSLHWASLSGNIAVIEALLSHGVEVDSTDWSGKTSLMYAASFSREGAVMYLLDKGADPSLKSNLGKNLLHFSSQGGSITIIEAMLSRGLDINSRDVDDNTPLNTAVTFRNVEAEEYLLSKGAEKNPFSSFE